MYKITKNTASAIPNAQINVTDALPLELEVAYRCIDEVVLHQAKAHFAAAVYDSGFKSLGRLLSKHICSATSDAARSQ